MKVFGWCIGVYLINGSVSDSSAVAMTGCNSEKIEIGPH